MSAIQQARAPSRRPAPIHGPAQPHLLFADLSRNLLQAYSEIAEQTFRSSRPFQSKLGHADARQITLSLSEAIAGVYIGSIVGLVAAAVDQQASYPTRRASATALRSWQRRRTGPLADADTGLPRIGTADHLAALRARLQQRIVVERQPLENLLTAVADAVSPEEAECIVSKVTPAQAATLITVVRGITAEGHKLWESLLERREPDPLHPVWVEWLQTRGTPHRDSRTSQANLVDAGYVSIIG